MSNISKIATIESLSHEGRGIAHEGGKTIFLDNALPGEEVEFIYTHRRSKFSSGIATRTLKPSKCRVAPICIYYNQCGGCSFQHLSVIDQLNFKEKVFLEQMKHVNGVVLEKVDRRITGPGTNYRNRARLSVKYVEKKQQLLIGFHEKNGRYVNDIEECSILDSQIGRKLIELRSVIRSLSICKQIAQLEVACGSEIIALVLRNLQPFSPDDLTLLESFSREHIIEIYCQPGGLNTVTLVAGSNRKLSYSLFKHDIEIFFGPTDFIQTNSAINVQLVDLVVELLDLNSSEKILDLFCGIGNFTLPIAKRANKVVGVEGVETAVIGAKKNAIYNGLTNVDFYHDDLSSDFWDQKEWVGTYDAVLLDPPRTGAEKICGKIEIFSAKKIIYVSCNLATLTRDTHILLSKGYKIFFTSIADMYPHTKHLELVTVFVRC